MSKMWWAAAQDFQDNLSEQDRHRLLQMMRSTHYGAGKTIYSSALPGDVLYWIQQGEVDLYQRTPAQTKRLLIELGQGDLFGSLALVESGYKEGLALTIVPSTLLVLRKQAFEQLMRYFPDTGARLVEMLQQQQHALMQKRLRVHAKQSFVRLCRLLSHFVEHPAYQIAGEPLPFTTDARELANQIGCRPEAVQLGLHNLVDQGLIQILDGRIHIRDRAALMAQLNRA